MADESGQNDTNSTEQSDVTTESSETLLTGGEQEQGGESQADEGGEAEQAALEVPENYEFTMPDGMELDQGLADAVSPIFKELELSQEKAGKLTEAFANWKQTQAQEAQDTFNTQLETWATELKNDKEVGGDAYEKNAGIAQTAITQLGSPELKQLLESTGVGNNPAMFKFALSVGKLLTEDQPGSGDRFQEDQPIENRMYPNEKAIN